MRIYLLRHGETYINRKGGRFQGQIDTPEANLNEAGLAQAAAAGREFADKGIRFDIVYSSPQPRAIKTAMLASGVNERQIALIENQMSSDKYSDKKPDKKRVTIDDRTWILDDRLKELGFGRLEGARWEEMNPRMYQALMHDFIHYMPEPGMESALAFLARTGSFLEDLRRELLQEEKKEREEGSPFHQKTVGYGLEDRKKKSRTSQGFVKERQGKNILISTHGGTIRSMLANLHINETIEFWQYPVGNCAWYQLELRDGRFVLTDQNTKAEQDPGARKNN